MIILIGEPGSGKTTLAKRYIRDHPDWILADIEELRRKRYNNPWRKLERLATSGPRVFVESSGLSRRLEPILAHGYAAIRLHAENSLHRALGRPQRATVQGPGGLVGLHTKCRELLPVMYPSAVVLDTSGGIDDQAFADSITLAIAKHPQSPPNWPESRYFRLKTS